MVMAILRSFFALPVWVQVWVVFILVPMNMAGLVFVDHPVGFWSAVLGILGMAPNVVIILVQRGFSKMMALPHLLPWTVLVIYLLIVMTGPGAPGGLLAAFAWGLIIVDTISLAFDYRDAVHWWRGDRAVAGSE